MGRLIIYIDMDGVLADFDMAADLHPNKNVKGFRPDLELDFTTFNPIPGAIEAVKELIDMGHDVYFATTAPWDKPESWAQKRIWIGKHFPEMRKRLIITAHKNLLKGDVLIDDHLWNGAKDFEGLHIHFGQIKRKLTEIIHGTVIEEKWSTYNWKDWENVIKYIKDKL